MLWGKCTEWCKDISTVGVCACAGVEVFRFGLTKSEEVGVERMFEGGY